MSVTTQSLNKLQGVKQCIFYNVNKSKRISISQLHVIMLVAMQYQDPESLHALEVLSLNAVTFFRIGNLLIVSWIG